ncbi:nucleoside deaminase [Nocardioides humilatus]|uniref:Nucleoside deaminase n=1 Tax=Nocardioides humilatus TaxID=2607660 RepID=A0A5B1LFP2_9ACTN|nr:nucleoside deaminase [Nocardioides humilatus]KAA1418998.1 nucleoside deaminase [Nocardioides humilatus]
MSDPQNAGDDAWLARAVELATANVASGGGPFGAVIVRGDELVSSGQNRVTRDIDPTAHAEVVAIRAACASIGDFSLAGCTLFTSCEPCPLCVSAALWARLDRVVFAADRDDAARGGFDDRAFYELFSTPRSEWAMTVTAHPLPDGFAPFQAWLSKDDRIRY